MKVLDRMASVLLESLKAKLPFVGVLAFSMYSVASVYYLLEKRAAHPHPMLWFAAALVELTTAWIVAQVVGTFRKVTRSNISKQDRRFYSGVLTAFLALCAPSLGLSIWANTVEFGTRWLGVMFPLLSVGCAMGAALPGVAAKREKDKAKARLESDKKRAKNARAKAELEQVAAQAEQTRAELEQRLGTLSAVSRQVLDEWARNPRQVQADIAQAIGVTRQVVGYHTAQLEKAGFISRNDGKLEVLAVARSDNGRE